MASAFDVPLSEQTLALVREGERGAQAAVYSAFEKAVYSLARRMVGDPDAALDIVQETFMKAFARMHQFRGDAPFGAWLRSIAASEALMHLRRGRYFMSLFTTDEDVMASVGREDVSDTDLERALGLLDSVPRSVLWLYHVEGYTHAEIAAMCGKTTSFSKSQLSRAHQKLRALLAGKEAAKVTEDEMAKLVPN
ncbi:MAG TPA: sigma-70 family RNA polymerase sigma factor [Candidatus Binatia bacterium]|nr:sigma-70 family RNA polymerase sigma factor [Candidatus Binatia bacterium]